MGLVDRWTASAELGASRFFGNTRQSTLTSQFGVVRADSEAEVDLGVRFSYGEASGTGGSFANKRSWRVNTGIDLIPYHTLTPFAFASYEKSLEQAIAGRVSTGAGAKYAIIREGNQRLDVSLALLLERTTPRAVGGMLAEGEWIRRWSTRFRFRRTTADERVSLNAVVWYRPELTRFRNYTIDLESALGIKISSSVAFSISLIDRYDSRATDRGATSNNDGQLLFGLVKTF